MSVMPSPNASRGRTAVYRIRDEDGVLIYIGMTNNPAFRWNSHQMIQPWWGEVHSVTFEWHETRDEAAAAEKAAIFAEQPKYNVTYIKPSSGRKWRQHPDITPVDWENSDLEPRDDDENLLNLEGVAERIAVNSTTTALNALKRTAGPKGFMIGTNRVFRKGEIRAWIAAIEAAQREDREDAA